MNKASNLPAPPRAEQRPFTYERHGVTIDDPWAWLRDKGYPDVQDKDVLDYLKAENAYFEAAMKPHEELVEALFQEMKGRIKEDDASVPIKDGDWLYWSAFKEGTQYRDWYRKPAAVRRRGADLQRECRGRGQGILPPRRLRGQPGRQAAGDPGRRRRVGTVQACRSRPCHRKGPRDRHRGRHRQPGLDQRFDRPGIHRGQRPVAQLPRPISPYRRRSEQCEHHLRGTGGYRLLGRRRAIDGRQLHLHFDRQ